MSSQLVANIEIIDLTWSPKKSPTPSKLKPQKLIYKEAKKTMKTVQRDWTKEEFNYGPYSEEDLVEEVGYINVLVSQDNEISVVENLFESANEEKICEYLNQNEKGEETVIQNLDSMKSETREIKSQKIIHHDVREMIRKGPKSIVPRKKAKKPLIPRSLLCTLNMMPSMDQIRKEQEQLSSDSD